MSQLNFPSVGQNFIAKSLSKKAILLELLTRTLPNTDHSHLYKILYDQVLNF